MVRHPAVAGSFYPADPKQLSRLLAEIVPLQQPPNQARGLIVPHAGYVYSGGVAGELIGSTAIPKTVVLLGPNHHGSGNDIALSGADSWETPLQTVPIAQGLRDKLNQEIELLEIDERAHQFEHSLEVMLPLLLQVQSGLQIVPISIRSLSCQQCLDLAAAIAAVLQDWPDEVLLLASSDMNHFLDAETTKSLDFMAIEQMTRYDPRGLYQTVRENGISMCGVIPAVIVMETARLLGANRCELVSYSHSGKINGDNSRVVGYAGLRLN